MILGSLFDWLGFWCLRGILDCCLLLVVRVKPGSLGVGCASVLLAFCVILLLRVCVVGWRVCYLDVC